MRSLNRENAQPGRRAGNQAAMQSLIFPDSGVQQSAQAPARAVPTFRTSANHPLSCPPGAQPYAAPGAARQQPSGPADPASVAGVAGRPAQREVSVRAIITNADTAVPTAAPDPRPAHVGERCQYSHPTYQIGRSVDGRGMKSLLYPPEPPPAAAPEAAQPDPELKRLHAAYVELAAEVPTFPRDAEGNVDERAVYGALLTHGIELSVDGFGELLARCDVSPEGFPAFEHFVGCTRRPHRELPQRAPGLPEPDAPSAPLAAAPPQPDALPQPNAPPQPAAEPNETAGGQLAEEELPPVAQTMRQLHVAPDARANRVSASGTLGMPLGAAKVTPIGLNVKRQIDARGAGALGRKAEFSKHYDADAFVL